MNIPPEGYIALIGLFTTLAAYLAGRNRHIIAAYQGLIVQLGKEIDRLHVRVRELETVVDALRVSRRRPRTTATVVAGPGLADAPRVVLATT